MIEIFSYNGVYGSENCDVCGSMGEVRMLRFGDDTIRASATLCRKCRADLRRLLNEPTAEWHEGEDEYGSYYTCSACGHDNPNYDADEGYTRFCPSCGARMLNPYLG